MLDPKLAASRAQEERVARQHAGKVTKGSGNGWIHKSDVATTDCLWEMKRTDKASIVLKRDDLEKARKYAIQVDKEMRFHLEIGDRSYVLMAEPDYNSLVEAVNGE